MPFRETTVKFVALPSEKGSTVKEMNLLFGSKFSFFTVGHFTEGNWCAGKQTERHKSCLPCKNGRKSLWFQSLYAAKKSLN